MFLLQMFTETLVNPKNECSGWGLKLWSQAVWMKIHAPHLLSVGNLKQVI